MSKLNTGRFALRAMLPVKTELFRQVFDYTDSRLYILLPLLADSA